MVPIKGLQHCSFIVRDLDTSRWFYGEVIGLQEVPRPSTFAFRGAWYRFGSDEIHLISADDSTAPAGMRDPGPARRSGLATHVAFEVADLDGLLARLEAHGIELAGGPAPRGDGVTRFWVQDPDGYLLEFFQWTGPAGHEAEERGPIRS